MSNRNLRRRLLLPSSAIWLAALGAIFSFANPARGGGFDQAINSASRRVVKLYGLGAGVQVDHGTGVIVSEDGLVLTVMSLLIDSHRIRAIAPNGMRFGADVVYQDPARQLAVLQLKRQGRGALAPNHDDYLDAPGPFPFFDLSPGSELTPGDWVVAAGNPFRLADGAEPVSISHGVFSARTTLDARRRLKDFPYKGKVLVIDAITSNPGAPGSALVNLDGEFVGMIGRVVVSHLTHTHLNYAMPRDVLSEFMMEARRAISAGRHSPLPADVRERPTWDPGIRLVKTGYQKVLPFVDRVRRDSPAYRAGVRTDDLILSVNGRAVPDADAYDQCVRGLTSNKSLDLVIRRGRMIKTIRVVPVQP